MNTISKHGLVRSQQRSLPKLAVNWLLDYGQTTRKGKADVYYLDKRSRRALEHDMGRTAIKKMSGYLNSYVVVADDGTIVTVGHRHRHLKKGR